MGQAYSCTSAGALLMVAAANGDVTAAQEIIRKHPRAALFHNFKDKSSPLIQAAARGHFELLQMILEAAVTAEGPEKAKKACIDHVNLKKQTALMVACKHGHPECVEYLVSNGADPLICDERRHNTCLHLGALYGHSECIHKLLGARSNHTVQGRQLTVAQMPYHDDALGTTVKFVDCHNGWGLTALHIAVFQGAVNTARALLRHGASLETVIIAPRVESSPIRCAVGSNTLHIAALVGNVAMARVVLEAQEAVPGLELRSALDSAGLRPQEYAQRSRNLVMVHLLDERLPVHLLRQVWLNYSLDGGMPARHQTLGALLQKLKLMFNLEVIAAQRNISVADNMLAALDPHRHRSGSTPLAGGKSAPTDNADINVQLSSPGKHRPLIRASEPGVSLAAAEGGPAGEARTRSGQEGAGAASSAEIAAVAIGAVASAAAVPGAPADGSAAGTEEAGFAAVAAVGPGATADSPAAAEVEAAGDAAAPAGPEVPGTGTPAGAAAGAGAPARPGFGFWGALMAAGAAATAATAPAGTAVAAAGADAPATTDGMTPAAAATSGPAIAAAGSGADEAGASGAAEPAAAAATAAQTPEEEPSDAALEEEFYGQVTTIAQQNIINMKAAWHLRLREIQALLVMVSLLYDGLQRLVGAGTSTPAATEAATARATAHEAILDFILSMLITPRTVSAVLHSAKKLVTATVQAAGVGPTGAGGGGGPHGTRSGLTPPSTTSEAQHSMGLLLTALKAVETCLQAAAHLSEGATGGIPGAAAAIVGAGALPPPPTAAARARAWAAVDGATRAESVTAATAERGSEGAVAVSTLEAGPSAAGAQELQSVVTPFAAVQQGEVPSSATTGQGATSPDPEQLQRPSARPVRGSGAQQPFLLDQPDADLPPAPASAAAQALSGDQTIIGNPDLANDPVHMLRMEMVAMVPGNNTAAAGNAGASAHWSSHLHTLLAQLQWDIGIQRHRRRRQHAAAAAARAAGSTVTATAPPTEDPQPTGPTQAIDEEGETGFAVSRPSIPGTPAPAGATGSRPIPSTDYASTAARLASSYGILAHRQQLLAAAHQDMEEGLAGMDGLGPPAAGALSVLYRVLSRRGDAPQDVLIAPGPLEQGAEDAAGPVAELPPALRGPEWGSRRTSLTDAALSPNAHNNTEWNAARRALRNDPATTSRTPPGPQAGMGSGSGTHERTSSGRRVSHTGGVAVAGRVSSGSEVVAGDVDVQSQRLLDVGGRPSGQRQVLPNGQTQAILRPVEVEALGTVAPAGRSHNPSAALSSSPIPRLEGSHTSLLPCSLATNPSGGGKVKGKDAAGSECQGDDLGDSDSGCGSISSDSEAGVCAICMDLPIAVMVNPCSHGVCVQCALQLTIKGRELPSCPFCRRKISGFEHKAVLPPVPSSRLASGAVAHKPHPPSSQSQQPQITPLLPLVSPRPSGN